MPLYEYYCRSCSAKFELLRPMSESSKLASCPSGHSGATRSVSLVARPSRGGSEFDLEASEGGVVGRPGDVGGGRGRGLEGVVERGLRVRAEVVRADEEDVAGGLDGHGVTSGGRRRGSAGAGGSRG